MAERHEKDERREGSPFGWRGDRWPNRNDYWLYTTRDSRHRGRLLRRHNSRKQSPCSHLTSSD